mmetsp:Transcript_5716/g.6551  ORF Transcript_5716/g.6551 Transcript_5716/m.6551 type:complete len:201 (-) Transcript_5716:88-690(-)
MIQDVNRSIFRALYLELFNLGFFRSVLLLFFCWGPIGRFEIGKIFIVAVHLTLVLPSHAILRKLVHSSHLTEIELIHWVSGFVFFVFVHPLVPVDLQPDRSLALRLEKTIPVTLFGLLDEHDNIAQAFRDLGVFGHDLAKQLHVQLVLLLISSSDAREVEFTASLQVQLWLLTVWKFDGHEHPFLVLGPNNVRCETHVVS